LKKSVNTRFVSKSCFSKRFWSLWMPSTFIIIGRTFNCNPRCHVGRHGQWLELWLKHLIQWWNNVSLIKFEGFGYYQMFCRLPWTLMWNYNLMLIVGK
jgi:hypothetical protein